MAAMKRVGTVVGAAELHVALKESAPSRGQQRRHERLATVEKERDDARQREAEQRAAAQRSNLAANVATALAGQGFDAVQIRRAQNMVENERTRCTKANETFDYRMALVTAEHAVRQRAGSETTVAPPGTAPMHPSATARPQTWVELQQERERYNRRLRELGLTDPAFGSIPGGG